MYNYKDIVNNFENHKIPLNPFVQAFTINYQPYFITRNTKYGLSSRTHVRAFVSFNNNKWYGYNYLNANISGMFLNCGTYMGENELWIGSEKGITILKDGEFSKLEGFNNKNDLDRGYDRVTSIFQDSQKRKWIATDEYIYVLNEKNSVIKSFKIERLWISSNTFFVEDNQNRVLYFGRKMIVFE